MKYKVGDKIRVRRDLVVGKTYRGLDFLPGHKKECGKIFTIEYSDGEYYRLNGSEYWWSEEMLEEVDEMGNVKIKIAVDGNKVTAKMGKETGIAKCSPEDEFDIFVGARLALERLEEKCKPYAWLKEAIGYYHPSLTSDKLWACEKYTGSSFDEKLIKRGLVFRTREEAIEAAKKMLTAIKESDSNDE